MRNAKTRLAAAAMVFALAACQKQQARDQNMSLGNAVPSNEVLANAEIETLPADESSETPSNQLENGYDNPDVNDLDDNSE
jgi:hypothetical protein